MLNYKLSTYSNFRMADFQDHDILNYYFEGDALLGPHDEEEEPMDQGDYDSVSWRRMRFNLNCKLTHQLSRRSKACSSVGTGTSSSKMIP